MRIRQMIAAMALAAGIGGLIVPALAQDQGGPDNSPDQGMTMDRGMGHGMMSRGMMRGGMMSGGCAGMMQSMNGGDERPNSQWRRPATGNATRG
jgi:hypothetical protein